MESKNPTIYVIVNKSLNMNPGKAMAQVAHAVSGMISKLYYKDNSKASNEAVEKMKNEFCSAEETADYSKGAACNWHQNNPRTVIILECEDQAYMERFSSYLNDTSINLLHYIYTDESSDFYKTAMAIEPIDKFDPRMELIFGQFNLYKYNETTIKDLDSEIKLKQYDNLRYHFNKLVEEVLGKNYYNEGMDTYSCDEFCCRDLKRKLKGKRFK